MNSHSSLDGGCCHLLQGTGVPTSDDFRERPCDDRKCILNIDTPALAWQMLFQCTWRSSFVSAALQWEFLFWSMVLKTRGSHTVTLVISVVQGRGDIPGILSTL